VPACDPLAGYRGFGEVACPYKAETLPNAHDEKNACRAYRFYGETGAADVSQGCPNSRRHPGFNAASPPAERKASGFPAQAASFFLLRTADGGAATKWLLYWPGEVTPHPPTAKRGAPSAAADDGFTLSEALPRKPLDVGSPAF